MEKQRKWFIENFSKKIETWTHNKLVLSDGTWWKVQAPEKTLAPTSVIISSEWYQLVYYFPYCIINDSNLPKMKSIEKNPPAFKPIIPAKVFTFH